MYTFEAGRLKNYIGNWRKITSDPNILDIVEHCHVEFLPGCDPVNSFCFRRKLSQKEDAIIENEIQKLLKMKVIKEVEHTPGRGISISNFHCTKERW